MAYKQLNLFDFDVKNKVKSTEDRYDYNRRYNINNKDRKKELWDEYYAKNADYVKQKAKERREANLEVHLERVRAYRRNNRENLLSSRRMIYQQNREQRIQDALAYARKNPDIVNARNSAKRANKRSCTPKWLNVGHKVEIYGYYQWCKIFKGHNVDHIYPLMGETVKGLHVPWNLQILTQFDNISKKNKMPDPNTIAPYIERPVLKIDADGFASLEFPNE